MLKKFLAVTGCIFLYMIVWSGLLLLGWLITQSIGDSAVLIFMLVSSFALLVLFVPFFNFALKKIFYFRSSHTPVTIEQLRAQIEEINTYNLPVMVQHKKEKIIVTWKYLEQQWLGLLAKAGLQEIYALHIKFNDAKKEVILADVTKQIKWQTGLTGLKLSSSFFRGVIFAVQFGQQWIMQPNQYTFKPSEIKNPVCHTILQSGWNIRFAIW